MVNIFIDESGTFTFQTGSKIALVGALVIPDSKYDQLVGKYSKIRKNLPLENGEVKGRLLNERQVASVVSLLIKNMTFLEINAVDLALQTESQLSKYREGHIQGQEAMLDSFEPISRSRVRESNLQIANSPLQLYLQALLTTHLMPRVINNASLYYVQRQPKELGKWSWVVDGKEKSKVTNWEIWLSWFLQGAMSTITKKRPLPILEGADYSHFSKFDIVTGPNAGNGHDIKKLMSDFRFSSSPELGLELVDIVVTATRRALVGNLGVEGFKDIGKLMIHHRNSYINFLIFGPDIQTFSRNMPYSNIVNDHFSRGGRSMIPEGYFRTQQNT